MAIPLKFVRFGRRPMWVSHAEILGEGDGETTAFPLPKGFGRHQHPAVYVAGTELAHDLRVPEHEGDTIDDAGVITQGPVKTELVDGTKVVCYKKHGWKTQKDEAGDWWLVLDQPAPAGALVTISRIFATSTLTDVTTGKLLTDAVCFKFAVLSQTDMAALMMAQPQQEEEMAALAAMSEDERKQAMADRVKTLTSASPAEQRKQLEETTEKNARISAQQLLWSDQIFKRVVTGWANMVVEDENGGQKDLPFTPENVDAFLGLTPDSPADLREGSLMVGLWVMVRVQAVIAAQNAKTGDLAGN